MKTEIFGVPNSPRECLHVTLEDGDSKLTSEDFRTRLFYGAKFPELRWEGKIDGKYVYYATRPRLLRETVKLQSI